MTRATTAADRRAVWVAWASAAVLHLGLLLVLWQLARPTGTDVRPPEDASARRVVERADRRSEVEARQRARVLPEEHARKLMEQSELLVRQELRQRLGRFEELQREVIQREERLLERIKRRPTVAEYSSEVNSTAKARADNALVFSPLPPRAPIPSLYDRLAELETQIQESYTDARAAELALRRGQSFPAVRALLAPNASRMPAFQAIVADEVMKRSDAESGSLPPTAARLEIRTVDDLHTYRQVLERSSRESALAETRLSNLLRPPGSRLPPPGPGGFGTGQGSGDGLSVTFHGRRSSEASQEQYRPKLDPEIVQAQALPGRRFSRDSPRRGWLYINTWYMIGPWDNYGQNDFAIVHPPELGIDFDAVYTDGMRGIGIAEEDAHPIEVRGKEVRLDGTLRWKFLQSESIHNVPPVTIDWSTYYAYTELYFDEPERMLVAIGTDDSGKVWINGEPIWLDRGMSWYRIDEHIQPFQFQRGVNRVLVRLENDGGGATGFSFLVCPAEAIDPSSEK